MTALLPPFDVNVPADGYRWWYVDAIAPDGRAALTLIAFVGSVFSPWYARARRRRPTDPARHCTLNAVVYGRRSKRWAFTERGVGGVHRSPDEFRIGPSRVLRDGDSLVFEIDEITVPVPTRLRGTVRVTPEIAGYTSYTLDADGGHHWRPIAPRAHVEVRLSAPATHWSGHGYLDSNWGNDALERAFAGWEWSRMSIGDASDRTAILYDTVRRDGSRHSLALHYGGDGAVRRFEAPAETRLARTGWRVNRSIRSEVPAAARVIRTLEDTPFYARSIVESRLLDATATGVHESLSLTRFASPWVQCLLPFRAPRR